MKNFARQKTPARWTLLLAICLSAFSPSLAAERSPRYSVIPLGEPSPIDVEGWSENYVYPQCINNKGDVVGERRSSVVLYGHGRIYDLGYLREPFEPYAPAWLRAMNERGEILGIAYAESPISFVHQSLPRPLPLAEARMLPVRGFVASGFNNYGTVVGYTYDRQTEVATPVVYRDGRVTELFSPFPGGDAIPSAINDRGEIVGAASFHDGVYRAVIWSGGRIKNLGILPGFDESGGGSINNQGEVLGGCYGPDGNAGFIYRRGVMRPLPFPPGARQTFPVCLNNKGDVLMYSVTWTASELSTDVYTFWLYADGVLHDLTAMAAWPLRWRVQGMWAFDMNDRGEIVGIVQYLDRNLRSFSHGVLLVPDRNAHQSRISPFDRRLPVRR